MGRQNILAVIPVSGQDPEFKRGLPRLNNRSLLGYTFDAVRSSKLVGRTIVWTDDQRVARASRRAGIEVPIVRPRRRRRSSMAELLGDAVDHLERAERDYRPKWIVRLQVTFPFRPDDFIDRAIRTVIAKKLDSAFVALPEFDTFWHLGSHGTPERLTTDTRVPRANRDPIYRELGGLFSMVRRSVLARGLLYGDRLGIIQTESLIEAVDLHSIQGFELARMVGGVMDGRKRRRSNRRVI